MTLSEKPELSLSKITPSKLTPERREEGEDYPDSFL